MAKNSKVKKNSNKDNNKYLKYAFYTLILIIIITLIGANDFNLNAESELLDVKASELFTDNYAKIPVKILKIPIKILHINNDYFLPRSYVVPRQTACLYNSETKKTNYLGLMIDEKDFYQTEAIEVSLFNTKDIKFFVTNTLPRKAPTPRKVEDKSVIDVNMPLEEVDTDYDAILLLHNKNINDNVDCYSLTEEQINSAEKVSII